MEKTYTPYSALAIANFFLENYKSISPMKIQKLIYFSHGWNLAIAEEPLIDEPIQAWDYGPVIPSVYYEFNKYGGNLIEELASDIRYKQGKIYFYNPMIDTKDDLTKSILEAIWDTFGKYTAIQLSNLTHQHDSPWYIMKEKKDLSMNKVVIPDDLIKEYFTNQFKNNG